jgi:UDP-glucose 4-epimerase
MATAFVAGAAGAIGRHCVALLRARGWTVGGIGHGNVHWESASGIDAWIAGEISTENLDALGERLGTPNLFVNLAGGSSVGPSLQLPLADFERTVLTGARILNWIWHNAPDASVSLASSAAVYGSKHDTAIAEGDALRPVSPYGHHKLMMERDARFWGEAFGVRSVVVRLFSVYGPGLRKQLVYDLCGRLSGAPAELTLSGTGTETRDWLWIEDAARLLVDLAGHASPSAPIFNGCTGTSTSIAEVAERLAALWKANTVIRFDGISRPGDPLHLHGNAARVTTAGFRPSLNLEEGLARTVEHWRETIHP